MVIFNVLFHWDNLSEMPEYFDSYSYLIGIQDSMKHIKVNKP